MNDQSPSPSNLNTLSVSELAFALKRTLETAYDHVRLRGEISKLTKHASGHVYLTLKDDKAALDSVIWKGQLGRLNALPEQGLEVIVTGKITTFPASSKYQLVIETLEAAGIGALLAQLERLKASLRAEGLFDPALKKPLPFGPKTIGVITSPTGAVIRDILHRIRDRWPCHVVVWPVIVQGPDAAPQIIKALKGFEEGKWVHADIIIVARGGGSVEDLWAFNDEALARQVSSMTIPIISAIGHETDTTLIDFVSDRRAPTPTAAAEMATPVLADLRYSLMDFDQRLSKAVERDWTQKSERLSMLARALSDPMDVYLRAEQRYDFLKMRLENQLKNRLSEAETKAASILPRLTDQLLLRALSEKENRLMPLAQRLKPAAIQALSNLTQRSRLDELLSRAHKSLIRVFERASERLSHKDMMLKAVDPERPLALGFARISRNSVTINKASLIKDADILTLHFHDGEIAAIAGSNKTEPLSDQSPGGRDTHQASPKKPNPAPTNQGQLF